MNDPLQRIIPLHIRDIKTYRAYSQVVRIPYDIVLIMMDKFTRHVYSDRYETGYYYNDLGKRVEFVNRELYYKCVHIFNVLPNGNCHGKYIILYSGNGVVYEIGKFINGVKVI